LEDFWNGQAEWAQELDDVGLPVGESDTIAVNEALFWSYTHASFESAGIIDQCGEPVAFPGCAVHWESTDGGENFSLPAQVCMLPCQACPCTDARDHQGTTDHGTREASQQYPRVVATEDVYIMVYEWHAQTMLRTSPDGLVWSDWTPLTAPSGTWPSSYIPCSDVERIGPHPYIRGEVHDCLVGAPPGLFVEDETLYVFVSAGSAPGHMRCYKGSRDNLGSLQICDTDPLFSGAETYGPMGLTGAAANAYFDFRYMSSADVLQVGDRYYMMYEGVRGPEQLEIGRDTQFGLGLARSTTSAIDGPWEKFPGNPILEDIGFNWGIGHADLIVVDGITYLYTTTSIDVSYGKNQSIVSAGGTRGRYRLQWKDNEPSG
jgi:hypothetical protein